MSDKDLEARRERLRTSLADREYADQYADSVLFEDVAAQVQALRRQRGVTQERLAELIHSKQPRISNVESPHQNPDWPNWEVATLNRIAHALGTRLEIRFRDYDSLFSGLGTLTTEKLRVPAYEENPGIFPPPPMPEPDAEAPERTQWMQRIVIPWLWCDELGLHRLYEWLNGRGLPPVGHDEEPYQWLLRGISIPGKAREHLEKRLAERLAIIVGEQPDATMRDGGEDFLRNLFWACAGLRRRAFLAEQLWLAYKRLKETRLRGDIRDALQAALVQNQLSDGRPFREIWEPMVAKGRNRWLRGDEIVGYEGILARHATVEPQVEKILWALETISHRWDEGRKAEFKQLLSKFPDRGARAGYRRLLKSAESWSPWAQSLIPSLTQPAANRAEVILPSAALVVSASFRADGRLQTAIRSVRAGFASETADEESFTGRPNRLVLNQLVSRLSDMADDRPTSEQDAPTPETVVPEKWEAYLAHELVLEKVMSAAAAY